RLLSEETRRDERDESPCGALLRVVVLHGPPSEDVAATTASRAAARAAARRARVTRAGALHHVAADVADHNLAATHVWPGRRRGLLERRRRCAVFRRQVDRRRARDRRLVDTGQRR